MCYLKNIEWNDYLSRQVIIKITFSYYSLLHKFVKRIKSETYFQYVIW